MVEHDENLKGYNMKHWPTALICYKDSSGMSNSGSRSGNHAPKRYPFNSRMLASLVAWSLTLGGENQVKFKMDPILRMRWPQNYLHQRIMTSGFLMDSADEKGHELPKPPSIKLCLDLGHLHPQHVVQAFHLNKNQRTLCTKGGNSKPAPKPIVLQVNFIWF